MSEAQHSLSCHPGRGGGCPRLTGPGGLEHGLEVGGIHRRIDQFIMGIHCHGHHGHHNFHENSRVSMFCARKSIMLGTIVKKFPAKMENLPSLDTRNSLVFAFMSVMSQNMEILESENNNFWHKTGVSRSRGDLTELVVWVCQTILGAKRIIFW